MYDDSPHLDRVAALARAAARRPVVIAVDGRSGAGKTTFAERLADRLERSLVIHVDDLCPGWDGLAAIPALLTAQVLVPLRRGEPAAYRRFDWYADEFADLVPLPETATVIVEGAGSSVSPARGYVDVRVWLEAGEPERKERALARDGETYRPNWRRWADQEDRLFAADDTRAHAHVVVHTT
ncbi:AAA family ATPase [Flexivirga caeni]|uniref:Uridine kinase n=1 Tax=Flexivirga caeni TaxID=2294115 RepID=A0A3M9LYY8_9MICO|nr:AAA family ATPase [Flexivirga caeni]RNI18155.1 hypothetical protein EFY87_18325 [Flexivirga caeni]